MQVDQLGADHPGLVETLTIFAELALEMKQPERGHLLAAQAVAMAKPGHPMRAIALARSGRAELALGHTRAALASLERAAAEPLPRDPLEAGHLWLLLARASRTEAREPAEIGRLVELARTELVAAGPRGSALLAELEAFAARGR
jgi:hypothetical protein